MQRQIITTKDNSKTLLIPSLNETYHSTHGAITESKHIYIKHGLEQLSKSPSSPITIFEMGFGSGLNCILTINFALKQNLNINYITIEKFPLSLSETNALGYINELNYDENLKTSYNTIHNCKFDKQTEINANFKFTKHKIDLKFFTSKPKQFDLIYFDAFAPQHQPDLWTVEILKKMYEILKPEGFLITYCAQGQFKRNLKTVGFYIKNLEGPPGKREITKAIKL